MASAQPTGVWMCALRGSMATATAGAVWTATGRIVRTDPTAALRVE